MIHFTANYFILEICAFKKRDYYKPESKLNASFKIRTFRLVQDIFDSPSADVNLQLTIYQNANAPNEYLNTKIPMYNFLT